MNEKLSCRIQSAVQNQMNNFVFYVCCFVCISYISRSQVNEHSNKFINDSIYFSQCEDSLRKYLKTDLLKAKLIAKNSLKFADSSSNIQWQVLARLMASAVLIYQGGETNALESIRLCKEALSLSETAGDSILVMDVANGLSNSYIQTHQLSEALQWSSRAIRLASDLEDKESLQKALISRANIYKNLGFYDRALEGYEILDSLLETSHGYLRGANFYNKGVLYQKHLNDPEQAWLNYKRAYDLFKENNDFKGLLASAVALGAFYVEQKEYITAKNYFREALQLADSANKITPKVTIHQYLAELYQFQGRIDSALHHIDRSLDLADTLHNLNQQMQSLKFKALLTEQAGDSTAALKYYHMAAILEDSLERRKNLLEAAKVLLRSESQEYEEQLSGYQRLLKNKTYRIWIALAGTLILGVAGIFIIRRYRSRLSSVRQTEDKLSQTLQTERDTKDHLNRQLVSKTANLATKNDLLNRLMSILDEMNDRNISKNTKKDIQGTQRLIEDNLELNKTWDEFFLHFEAVHPNFLESLRNEYQLSKTELKICAFIKINLSHKEIGQILKIKPGSVKISIYRIKKKLKLPDDKTLFDFL